MSPRSAPAALPAAAFLAGLAAAPELAFLPVPLVVALAAAGLALRATVGALCLALAAGGLLGLASAEELPSDDRGRLAEARGRICGFWRERDGAETRSARLCPEHLRQGRSLLLRPPRIWLELPAAIEPPPYGTRIEARGTLSRFPGLANEVETPPGPWRLRVKSSRHLRRAGEPRALERAAAAVRGRLVRSIARAGDPSRPGIALARALVLGDEGGLGEERTRALRRAGLAHLLAVSGFNVTLLAALAALVSGAASPRGRLAAPALAIVLYLAAVGPEPSLLRASWMSAAALGALALRRPGSAPQALALTAALLAALEPRALRDPGFQLSFGATLALLAAGERWAGALEPLPRPLARALAVSLAAQAGTLPWSVAAFGEATPAAPLWNLFAVPWAAVWMVVGLAWTLVAAVAPALARPWAPLLDLGAAPFAALERLPPSALGSFWTPGGWLAGIALAATIVAAVELRRARGPLLLIGATLAVAPAPPPGRDAEVVFADVGQGDAAIVRAGGATLLVDGGGLRGRDLGAAALRPLLARRGVERVDLALLSHADADHCLGLVDLSSHLPIEAVWLPPGATAVECATRLAGRARRAARVVAAGARLELGGIGIEVLHPRPGSAAGGNRESLVVRVGLAGRRLLFTGDLPAGEERRLALELGGALAADVLKVAHHGSAGSSDALFVAAVGARWAVVSAGTRNAYGHPAEAALARLAAGGARVLRTDRDGQVVLRWRRDGPWHLALPGSPRRIVPER